MGIPKKIIEKIQDTDLVAKVIEADRKNWAHTYIMERFEISRRTLERILDTIEPTFINDRSNLN